MPRLKKMRADLWRSREVVSTIDNEPGNVNLFHRQFPDAINVLIHTNAAPGAPVPSRDFLILTTSRLGRRKFISRPCHLALDYSLLSSEMRSEFRATKSPAAYSCTGCVAGDSIAPRRCPSQRKRTVERDAGRHPQSCLSTPE